MILWNVVPAAVAMRLLKICLDVANLNPSNISILFFFLMFCTVSAEDTLNWQQCQRHTTTKLMSEFLISNWNYCMYFNCFNFENFNFKSLTVACNQLLYWSKILKKKGGNWVREREDRETDRWIQWQRDTVIEINRGGQNYPVGHLAGSRAAVHSNISVSISVTSSHDLWACELTVRG